MNKQEFFAAVKAYKEGKPLQPKVSRDYTIDDWADQYYDQAVALKAKALLAHSFDRSFDADIYNQQLGILTHMLDGMDESAEILADIESDAKEVLEHGEWKKHKYIRIENGRYIYPEDLEARKKESDAKYHQVASEIAANEAHKMNVYNESGKEATKKYNKLLKEKHENAQQAESLKKEASELKDQADKKRFDKSTENLAERNAERKEKEAESVRSKDDNSKNQAQREGEAMQAWKNAQAVRAKDNNSKNQAESSMEGYESWKKDQAAKKRFEEGKAATIDRVAELESGLRKEEFDGELRIRKQALADANVDQKSIDDAKARKAEAIRAKDDNSKNQAQKEGEAMQAWKNQQEAKRKEYEADIKKMASESISAWASGEDDNNGGKYAAKVNEIGDKYVWDKSITADKMISDYANAVYEEYLKKKDGLSPEVRTRIENALSNIEDKYKPKKVTHSFDLSTKEGYYAAIEEYKRKRSI